MSWRIEISRPQTLATKLTLWILVLFIGSSSVGFLVTYWGIRQRLYEVTDNQLSRELAVCLRACQSGGLKAAKAVLLKNIRPEEQGEAFFRILDTSGRELATSDLAKWQWLRNKDVLSEFGEAQELRFQTVKLPASDLQVRILYARLAPDMLLQRGKLPRDVTAMKGTRPQLYTLLGFLIVLSVGASFVLGRRATFGLKAVTRTAAAIAHGDLSRRVSVGWKLEEVDELAATFNGMLDRIQALLVSLKEVTDDIAHDLRSPITLIRGLSERIALASVPVEEHQLVGGMIVEECDRLLNLVNTMLDISELNAGAANLNRDRFDMTVMVSETCDIFQPLAEGSGISLETRPGTPAPFLGDREKLHRALANLVDNAIKYTPEGGHVLVSVEKPSGQIAISVTDDGIGIAEEDLNRVFERFYRPDQSRSKPGNGLGLSLAMAIAKAHGGTITVQSVVGVKTTFTLCLPVTS